VTGPDPDENEAVKATLAKKFPVLPKGKHDTEKLQAHLVGLKAKYPKSDTILVKPEDQIRYEVLVGVLDHIREKDLKEFGPDGNPKLMPLFPVVVFTTLNKMLPDGGVEGDGGVPEEEGAQ
jgi:hypothetical protein